MEIQFLGTSSGVPTKNRNVSAIGVVETKGNAWYLVDCGEGTQHQLLHSNLSLHSLCAVFITHVHGDHCYGLPGLLASAGMAGRRKSLPIVAPEGIKEWFESTQSHTQLYLPFELEFITSAPGLKQTFGQFSVAVAELSHRVPSFAYVFTEKNVDTSLDLEKLKSLNIPQGPLWGQLKSGLDVEHKGTILRSEEFVKSVYRPRKVIVCGDNDNPGLLDSACIDCDVLVHEATYTEDMAERAGEVGHSYAKQVAQFAEKNSIPNLLLTHFSPRYQFGKDASSSIEQLRQEAEREYGGNLKLAEDFSRYSLSKSGDLKQYID